MILFSYDTNNNGNFLLLFRKYFYPDQNTGLMKCFLFSFFCLCVHSKCNFSMTRTTNVEKGYALCRHIFFRLDVTYINKKQVNWSRILKDVNMYIWMVTHREFRKMIQSFEGCRFYGECMYNNCEIFENKLDETQTQSS